MPTPRSLSENAASLAGDRRPMYEVFAAATAMKGMCPCHAGEGLRVDRKVWFSVLCGYDGLVVGSDRAAHVVFWKIVL